MILSIGVGLGIKVIPDDREDAGGGPAPGPTGSGLLLEDGSYLLLETGDFFLLET
jgi:hypothetical protein